MCLGLYWAQVRSEEDRTILPWGYPHLISHLPQVVFNIGVGPEAAKSGDAVEGERILGMTPGSNGHLRNTVNDCPLRAMSATVEMRARMFPGRPAVRP